MVHVWTAEKKNRCFSRCLCFFVFQKQQNFKKIHRFFQKQQKRIRYFVAVFEQTGYLSPFTTSKGSLIIWI